MRVFTIEERRMVIFLQKEAGLTVGHLADELLMSKSNLSRIENGKIMVSDENREIIEKRFSIHFSINDNDLIESTKTFNHIIKLLIFYRLFDDFSIDDLERICQESKTCITYPVYTLLKFCIFSAKNMEQRFTDKYVVIFDSIINLFDVEMQKSYFTCKVNYLYHKKKYEEAIELCDYIAKTYKPDDLLDSYLLHLKAITFGCIGEISNVIRTLDQAIIYSSNTNNIMRLIALYITRANYGRLMKDYKLALEQDFKTLEYTKVHNVHIYDYILLRNIAWTYYLMDDYENAIKRYKIAEELDIDDDLCFITAYCYFKLAMDCESPSQKLDLRIQCKEYLNKGRRVKNSGIAFPYLIDWLELMLNKKYSLKAEQKLLYCLKKHETTMHVDSRNNIYKFLIEHYEYHQDSKNADYYRKKLQNG